MAIFLNYLEQVRLFHCDGKSAGHHNKLHTYIWKPHFADLTLSSETDESSQSHENHQVGEKHAGSISSHVDDYAVCRTVHKRIHLAHAGAIYLLISRKLLLQRCNTRYRLQRDIL